MKRLVFLVILLFYSACSKDNEFYNDKYEIMLRSTYIDETFISYLGIKNNFDVIIISSKEKVKEIYLNDELKDFTAIQKDEFNLPYSNEYLYTYKVVKEIDKKSTIKCEIILENNVNIKTNIQRISKSLEYHL